jgi:biotin carboxylase
MNEFLGKSILVMGATSQTVPFITKAQEMGIKVYCADYSESATAKRYADFPLLIDCFDIDQLEKVVEEKSIDGIVLGCADVLLPPYEELCRRTGKPCYATKEQVATFGNKKGLKIKLKEYGLPYIPEFSLVDIETIKDEDFPVFVKPVDNCSSKGMSVCYRREDLKQSVEKALGASRSKTILVERYMVCDDISITYTFVDGNVFVTSISDRYVNREQEGVGTITTALVYPSKYTQLYFDTIHDKACRMFREMGIKNGVLTMQSFVEEGKIMFYDPAFRTTGGQGYIIYNYFGAVDQIRMLIEFSLTGKMTEDISSISEECNFGSSWAVNLVLLVKTGIIKSIVGLDEAKKVPGVINVTPTHFEGDSVKGRGTLDQTLARLHIVADTKEELSQAIDSVIRGVRVFDTEDNDMLLTQFDTKDLQNYYV